MEETKETKKKKKGGKAIMTILGGKFLVRESFAKQFPFMVYVTLLLMTMITNTYIAEERNRELRQTTRKLNDLKVEYVEVKSAIMDASKQSVLIKRLNNTDIKEATEPLKRITIEQTEKTINE